jgi:Xaa-Pro aminopeptidase
MTETLSARVAELQRRMADDGIDVAVLTDPDTVYYLSGGRAGLAVGIERTRIPAIIAEWMRAGPGDARLVDLSPSIDAMRVGDSIVVTGNGYGSLTSYPNELKVL